MQTSRVYIQVRLKKLSLWSLFPRHHHGDVAAAAEANAAVLRTSSFQIHGKWVRLRCYRLTSNSLKLWNRRSGRNLPPRWARRHPALGLFKWTFWMLTFTDVSSCSDTQLMTFTGVSIFVFETLTCYRYIHTNTAAKASLDHANKLV